MAKGTFPQGNSGQLLDLVAIIAPFPRFCQRIGLLHSEQFATAGELLLAVAVAHEAVITDALKSLGQDMDQETSDELPGVERHYLLSVLVAIVLPPEAYLAILDIDDPVVGDCHPVCVASDIFENLLSAREGWLGIDHPVDAAGRIQIAPKSDGIAQPFQ